LKQDRPIEVLKTLITEVPLGDLIMLLKYFQEIKEVGIGMIKEFKPLSKITLSLMKKKRKRRLILKSIVLGIPPHFPI
jgi:hypothetical protein